MTHEQRASLIKKVFFLVLAAAVVGAVWFYPKPSAESPVVADKPIESPENGLAVVLHHLPGDPASEQMAGILDKVQMKYGQLIVVTKVDFIQQPELAKSHAVTKPPHVVIIAGTQKVFDFQGVWTQPKVEFKIEEILRGLKRMDKDWRPPVPGMKPTAE